jgi:nicotinamidase-related amidase
MVFSRLSRIDILQHVQEDFVMNTVNNAANFNGQKPVIDPGDAVLLLIDHQSGLFQTVKDMEMTVLRANVNIYAVHEGYKVFAVMDASGTYSKMAQEITLARIVQAGVVPIDTAAVCSEIQKTWSRPDAAQWAEAYSALFPPYQLLIESYSKAQEVVTQHEQLDSVLA